MSNSTLSLPRGAAMAVCVVRPQFAAVPSDFTLTQRTHDRGLWRECFSELLTFSDLQDDWDGLGAESPSVSLIRGAMELAETLHQKGWPAPCRVIAGITGAVLFEWQSDGQFVEVEVTSESSAEVLLMREGQAPRYNLLCW